MKHQGGVGSWSQRKWLQVTMISWRAQGGQWWLFPTIVPGADCGSVCLIPACRPGPCRERALTLPPCPTGCVPLDPQLSQSLEEGRDFIQEFPKSSAFPALTHIAQQILDTSQRSS